MKKSRTYDDFQKHPRAAFLRRPIQQKASSPQVSRKMSSTGALRSKNESEITWKKAPTFDDRMKIEFMHDLQCSNNKKHRVSQRFMQTLYERKTTLTDHEEYTPFKNRLKASNS